MASSHRKTGPLIENEKGKIKVVILAIEKNRIILLIKNIKKQIYQWNRGRQTTKGQINKQDRK